MENNKPIVLVSGKMPFQFQLWLEEVAQPKFIEKEEDAEKIKLDERKIISGLFTYGHFRVDKHMLDLLPNLKVISNFGVGVDHVDSVEATKRGIPVGNTPDVLSDTTADMGFALLLATARNIVVGHDIATSPKTTHFDPNFYGMQVSHTTIGILGMGRIGFEVAKRAKGFSMKILYHNRNRNMETENEVNAIYCDKETLFKESDFIVVVVPLSNETRHIVGKKELSLMKKTGILVNIGRGGLIDQNALVEALQNEQIWGAGLDVTEPEPLPRDHPLLKLKNVVIAPHFGSQTQYARDRMAKRAIDNLKLGLEGKKLLSCFNQEGLVK